MFRQIGFPELVVMLVIAVLLFGGITLAFGKRTAEIICPNQNCNYRGKAARQGGRSIMLLLFLLCLGVVPGVLYLTLSKGAIIVCPKCGIIIRLVSAGAKIPIVPDEKSPTPDKG